MARKGKLTTIAILKTKPASKPVRLFAGGGRYLEVMPTGSRYWRMKYRHAGKGKRLALDVFPAVTQDDACKARGKARVILADARDPAVARKADKLRKSIMAGNSFKSVADDWLAVKAPGWTPLQHNKEKGRLVNHAYPWIGGLPIAELGVGEIRPLLDRLVKAGLLEQAHRLREQLSRVFRHAVSNEKANRDPAHARRTGSRSARNARDDQRNARHARRGTGQWHHGWAG